MKIYQLEYFVEVAKCKSFSVAAKNLNITQPALSKGIQMIESEIGFKLFCRNNSGIEITEKGLKILDQSKAVLREMKKLENDVLQLNERNKIVFGIPPLYGYIYIPLIEAYLKKIDLGYKVSWYEAGSIELNSKLLGGTIDVAIIPELFMDKKQLSSIPFCTSKEIICVSRDDSLAIRDTVSIDELKNETFILFYDAYNQDLMFKMLDFKPKSSSFTSQIQTAMQLVQSGKGIMLVHEEIANQFENYRIKPLHLDPEFELNLVIAFKRDLDSSVKKQMRYLAEYFTKN